MNKTLTYSGFAISAFIIIAAFITAKTYTQLAIAVILYPLLAYFALKIIPRRNPKAPAVTIQIPVRPQPRIDRAGQEKILVADVEKRTFLKLIGAAGLSFFVFSILGRRVDSLLFDRTTGSGAGFGGTPPNNQASQPFEGYKISEIDDSIISYYGFTNNEGAWLIMKEDTETSSFRYAKGGTGFSGNWDNRENLKYDYYYNLF